MTPSTRVASASRAVKRSPDGGAIAVLAQPSVCWALGFAILGFAILGFAIAGVVVLVANNVVFSEVLTVLHLN